MNCLRSQGSSYINMSLQNCVKRLLKHRAPVSSMRAKTEAWTAFPSRVFTPGLIDEAGDTLKALLWPAVPCPP